MNAQISHSLGIFPAVLFCVTVVFGLLVGISIFAESVIGEDWTGKQPGAAALLYSIWGIVSGACLWSVVATIRFDRASRSAVMQHRGHVDRTESFRRLMLSVEKLRLGSCLWTSSQGGQLRPKYHGGAETAVDRVPVTLDTGRAPHLQTAREVTRLHTSFGTLHFFPDHIWVYRNSRYSIVRYESVVASPGEQQFVETGLVPRDAAVVGQTYQYVNRDGGPDRRFSNNPTIPIVRYGTLDINFGGSLSLRLLGPSPDAMREFSANLARYPSRQPAPDRFSEPSRPERDGTGPSGELSWNAAVEVLGVSAHASEGEITEAFRRLASQYHPDRVTHLAPEFRMMAEEKMRRINAAYMRLRDGRS